MCLAFDQMVEEGRVKGREEGRVKGREEGQKVAAEKIAVSLIEILDIQTISEKIGLTVEEIEELKGKRL